MGTPFFSIAIPTKGRSFIVGDAIQSVLRQTFADFEVIIADNDDGDATRAVVSSFKDPRVRYHRTGGLSMPDNWEAACSQVRGEYLLLLEDKQALHGKTLERIHSLIEKHHPPCLKWKADTLDDTTKNTWMDEINGTNQTRFISSAEILRIYLSGTRNDIWDAFPIGHLSAFSRTLRKSILAGPVGRLCPPVSPDYTIGTQALAYGEGVLQVDTALVAMSRKHSNGGSVERKTALGRQFMAELGGANRLWSRTPIQAPIVPALLFNDYVELHEAIGDRLKDFPPDWVNYYVESWRTIVGLENDGVLMEYEFSAFHSALNAEPAEMQQKVWQAIEQREGSPAKSRSKNRNKALRRQMGFVALEHKWKLLIRRLTGRRHINKFQRPLEYVIWADQHASRL
jgi:Glycosyl transferase family 2